MTKVEINPGVCGFVTTVTAVSEDEQDVTIQVESGCEAIQKMMRELGNEFDAFEECLVRPGEGSFFEYARTYFPVHAACPVIAGILKCIEVECRLALPSAAAITFV
ncbi:MAG: hypothetical protein J6A61_03500, partial [Clostridia bacterium]|nr:hypothetical protein [Clostridia bacterium]